MREKRKLGLMCLLLFACMASALAAAACSEAPGEPSTVTDPAQLAPVDTPVYAEFRLRPPAPADEHALEALRKLLDRSRPLRTIRRETGRDGLGLAEVEPWLGDRAAVFGTRETDLTVVLETTDPRAAEQSVRNELERLGAVEEQAVEGRTALVAGDSAAAVVDSFLVSGSRAAVSASLAALAAESVAEGELADDLDEASEGSLATAYFRVGSLIDLNQSLEDSAGEEFDRSVLGGLYDDPLLGRMRTDGHRVTFDLRLVDGGQLVATDERTTRALERQPRSLAAGVVAPQANLALSRAVQSSNANPFLSLASPFVFGARTDIGVFVTNFGDRVEGAMSFGAGPASQASLLANALRDAAAGRPVRSVSIDGHQGFVTHLPGVPVPVFQLESVRNLLLAFGARAATTSVSGPRLGGAWDYRRALRSQPTSFEPLAFVRVPRAVGALKVLGAAGEDDAEQARISIQPRSVPTILLGNVDGLDGQFTRLIAFLR